MTEVCLVTMPYAAIERPSIALGLLKARLTESDIGVTVVYASLWFAEWVGLDTYRAVSHSQHNSDLLGEWTFSGAAFPDFSPDHSMYLNEVLTGTPPEASYRQLLPEQDIAEETLRRVRKQAVSFVDHVVQEILKMEPRVVGCTSLAQQHCASLALLRRLRELDRSVVTLLGGGNCEGPMGLATHRAFSWVDYVVSGEADDLLPTLIRLLLESGRDLVPSELPHGVIGPHHDCLNHEGDAPRAVVYDLDTLPIPDYDDYFAELERSPLSTHIAPGLVIETSRGCWWGQKHQCTFCGLNEQGIKYRAKSPRRVLEELRVMRGRYGLERVEAVDNILDMGYFQEVLPALAQDERPWSIFYEVKANLSYEQMVQLAEGGVRWIQAGLESMHDAVLELLNKGNSTFQNIQLLRWALELGIHVSWNLLTGIPGEKDQWYSEMARWLPSIAHLQPPMLNRVHFDRFSAYCERPEAFGLRLSPRKAYSYIYPLTADQIADVAYLFEDYQDVSRGSLESPGLKAVADWVKEWRGLFWPQDPNAEVPVLYAVAGDQQTVVLDTRPCAAEFISILDGPARQVLDLCDRPQTVQTLSRELKSRSESTVLPKELEMIVDQLTAQRFLLPLNGKLLSLVARMPRSELLTIEEFPGGFYKATPTPVRTVG